MADDAANGYEDVNTYSIVDRFIVIRVNAHINILIRVTLSSLFLSFLF
jgi:hypothetical protein